MYLKSSLNFVYEFFNITRNQFRNLYLNSSFYNKKISKNYNKSLNYKPTLSILSCVIKYEKKKKKLKIFI